MPGMDGTGPLGTGPIGRGLGPCGRGAGWAPRSWWGGGFGLGRGLGQRFGAGFGRGFGWRYPVQNAPYEDEEEALRNEVNLLKQALDSVTARLDEIKTTKDQE